MILGDGIEDGLARLANLLADAEEPWWIIGSVAVALHGGSPGAVRDIDVVLGHKDAERYFRTLGLANAATSGSRLFRSDLFACWTEPLVRIELMAGLHVNGPRGWQPLAIETREEVRNGLFAPSISELRDILQAFGRPKDVQRAATLN